MTSPLISTTHVTLFYSKTSLLRPTWATPYRRIGILTARTVPIPEFIVVTILRDFLASDRAVGHWLRFCV
ncbi:hypothetical protein ACLB2K_075253 [Fragaria x ananassa]